VLLGEIAGIASAALWACSSLIMAGLTRRMPALALSTLRLCLGVCFYACLLVATGNVNAMLHVGWGLAAALAGSAVLAMGFGDTLYIMGMRLVGVSKASPISVTTYPLLAVVLAWLLLGEAMSVRIVAGTALILGGIVLVVARTGRVVVRAEPVPEFELVSLTHNPERAWAGIVMVLIASVTWAISTIWLRVLTEHTSLVVVNSVRVPAAALFLGSIAAGQGMLDLRRYRRRDLGLVAVAGIVGSGVGSLLYVYALREVGAGLSSLLNSLSPVFALPMAAWLLGERITKLTVAGTLVALLGLWVVIS
jgi:drug/metabolite transporter, DME family